MIQELLCQIEVGEHVDLLFEGDCKWYQGEVKEVGDGQITISDYMINVTENYSSMANSVKYRRDYTFNFDDISALAKTTRVIE